MIFKDIIKALNVNEYGKLRKRTTGDIIAYIAVIMLICSIGIVIIPTVRAASGIFNGFMQELPEFSITESGMTIDSTFDFDYAGLKMYATNEKVVTNEDFGDSYTGFLMDGEKVIIRSAGKTAEFKYNEFDFSGNGFKITKNSLPEYKKYFYIVIALFDLMIYAALLFSYILSAFAIAVISRLIAIFMQVRVSFGELFKLSVYSKTFPTIILAILTAAEVGFSMHVSLVVSLAFMYIALKKIKMDSGAAAL